MSSFLDQSLLYRAALLAVVPLIYAVRHSLPFSWHARVLLPYFIKRWRSWYSQSLPGGSIGQPSLRLVDLPIAKDPFQDSRVHSFIATIDDCDFLGHLSNSSYPKNLDISRSHYAAAALFQFQADGGWVPLSSVSFKFLNEITVLTRYNIRSSIYCWDEKWFCEYLPSFFSSEQSHSSNGLLKDLKNEFISKDKKGKEVLNCLSISKHCYKLGRKTIPPWFVLVYSGYAPASAADPMGNWKKSQALRLHLQKGKKGSNPLTAFKPGEDRDDWMTPPYWDTGDWDQECAARLKVLHQYW